MSDLSSLIARLEAAEGPSRKMDTEIAMALGIIPDREWWSIDYLKSDVIGRYTISIDAAVSLAERVLPGRCMSILSAAKELMYERGGWEGHQVPQMLPRFICLATLRALQQKGSSNG
ncbi:hypothetical protein [Shinella pollutisoli]|uniref:Uncharacterized protein n=1 Tax=Shinella pollutisoli TaxID=2250594 RepID=A0ABV7DBT5_9HYPH|nr:hypothetical protein [Shinella pollutisoli]